MDTQTDPYRPWQFLPDFLIVVFGFSFEKTEFRFSIASSNLSQDHHLPDTTTEQQQQQII